MQVGRFSMGSNPAGDDRDNDLLEQTLDSAAETVDFAIEMKFAQAVDSFAHSMGAVFREAGKTVLDIFQQLHSSVSRWCRGQHSGN